MVQEWSQKYLEDGESNSELTDLTPVQRKAHFINFVKGKYGQLITGGITDQINREAENYETAGVFERMSFGGTKRTKRRTVKGKKGTRKPKRRALKGTKNNNKNKKRTKNNKKKTRTIYQTRDATRRIVKPTRPKATV